MLLADKEKYTDGRNDWKSNEIERELAIPLIAF